MFVLALVDTLSLNLAAPPLKSLLAAGKDQGLGHFGTFTLDALRMEKGFKMWGNEMNLDVDAWEAGLAPFIRMGKTVREMKLNYPNPICETIFRNAKYPCFEKQFKLAEQLSDLHTG